MNHNSTFDLAQEQHDYLHNRLQGVSRSFALVIPLLEKPLNTYLATAYLICRVADNVEDCERSADWKQSRFTELALLLEDPAFSQDVLSRWDRESWPGLAPDERALMGVEHGQQLWTIYQRIPQRTVDVVRRWVLEMVEGMSNLSDDSQEPHFVRRGETQVLSDVLDYDQYCYIVAGTVGNLVTELIIQQNGINAEAATSLRHRSEAFGRGLQKTNIVKDFVDDLDRGICYLPDRWLGDIDYSPLRLDGGPPEWIRFVLANVLADLSVATDYILALPYNVATYRMASLMCVLPAYQTLLLAAQTWPSLFTSGHSLKISHETMAQCLDDGRKLLTDNFGIMTYRQRIEDDIDSEPV